VRDRGWAEDGVVPAGTLLVLVGPSGCGKSSWAAHRFAASEVVSSDALRELVAGDAADQAASADAFRLLHLIVAARLRRGLRTVVDATNLDPRSRATLLRIAAAAGQPAVALAFDVPLERCLAQNAARPGRRVPDAVVREQHARMAGVLATLPTERFAAVLVTRAGDGDGQPTVGLAGR
jgi:predicted kinase